MMPPIRTLSPVSTRSRVAMLPSLVAGVGVGVAVGVGVGDGIGVGVGVGAGVGPGTMELAIENSEVLPIESVAVAVMNWPPRYLR